MTDTYNYLYLFIGGPKEGEIIELRTAAPDFYFPVAEPITFTDNLEEDLAEDMVKIKKAHYKRNVGPAHIYEFVGYE